MGPNSNDRLTADTTGNLTANARGNATANAREMRRKTGRKTGRKRDRKCNRKRDGKRDSKRLFTCVCVIESDELCRLADCIFLLQFATKKDDGQTNQRTDGQTLSERTKRLIGSRARD